MQIQVNMTYLGYATQSLPQVAAAAKDWDLEVVLVNVVRLIRGRQHLALVDEVDANCFKNLSLHKVTDARLHAST